MQPTLKQREPSYRPAFLIEVSYVSIGSRGITLRDFLVKSGAKIRINLDMENIFCCGVKKIYLCRQLFLGKYEEDETNVVFLLLAICVAN